MIFMTVTSLYTFGKYIPEVIVRQASKHLRCKDHLKVDHNSLVVIKYRKFLNHSENHQKAVLSLLSQA